MGLRCYVSIDDYGFPAETYILGIPAQYSDAWEVFARTFLQVATDLVPVDTGYLQSSINAEPDAQSCQCVAEAEYAQYVEFGTYKMDAQEYFIPALEAAEAAAVPLMQEAWEEAQAEERAQLQEMMQMQNEQSGIGGGSFGLGEMLGVALAAVVLGVIFGFFNMIKRPDAHYMTAGERDSLRMSMTSGDVAAIAATLVEIT